MPANDPLAQLRDIHLPEPVGWWPPAPGWWLLGALLLLLLAAAAWWLTRRRRRNRYRRAAVAEARQLYASLAQDDGTAYLEQANQLLKRSALIACPQAGVESLHGAAWVEFLNARHPRHPFDDSDRKLLAEGLYRADAPAVDLAPFQQHLEQWLRGHRRC